MLKKAAALFLVCASAAICVSCGPTTSRYLYAAIPTSDEIVAFREDPNSGILTELAVSPITAGPAVQSLVIHPSNKYLYAANAGEGDVSLFLISSDGTIAESGSRTPVGTDPTVLAMDSKGAYLYVANTGDESISAFSISATSGVLTPVSQVSGPTAPLGIIPINLQVAGGFLYVTGAGEQGYIEVFSINNGVLTPLSPASFYITGTNPYGLAITPNGSYLYTANNVDNSISEFSVTSGALSQFSNSPIGQQTGYSGPVALLIDKSGKYLYVANQGTTNLAGYSIGSTDGSLTLLTTSPFGTGANPSVLASDSGGAYLFVGNQKSPFAIQSFSLDTSSGQLTSVHSYTVPNAPASIATTF
ncbi:MAG: beta-propeller fold lactonase family protein [Candidatus Sulfotelmatobacter sp.]|jgi:6-phosphogluconolactonase (cycloisomerase 2 family)